MSDAQTERHARRLEQLRRRFVALSLRSRSLRLARCTRRGALDLVALRAADPENYERLLHLLGRSDAERLPLCDQVGPPEAQGFAEDLRQLARASRDAWLQTGQRELAVGWPVIEGRCPDGTWLRGPLLLYPVWLEPSSEGRMQWLLDAQGPPDLNEPLARALQRLAGATLSLELLLGHDDDGRFCIDAPTWRGLRAALVEGGLPLAPGPRPLPPLEPLPPRPAAEREGSPPGSFALCPHLVLGRFPRSGSNVVADYDRLLAAAGPGLELGAAAALLQVDEEQPVPAAAATPPPAPPAEGRATGLEGSRRWQVFPSDASQDAAFRLLDGQGPPGLVVQGPPGTGKSQMIGNLLAAGVAQGKRVLLVCQKRAALDVVAERLAGLGLAEALAVVHDVERDRNPLCEALSATLSRWLPLAAGGDDGGLAQDLQLALGEHEHALQRVAARLAASQAAWVRLSGTRPGRPGLAALQERSLDDPGRPLPVLGETVAELDEAGLAAALPAAESLAPRCSPLASPHPLAQRGDWAEASAADLAALDERLRALATLFEQLAAAQAQGSPGGTPAQARARAALWQRCNSLLDLCEAEDPSAQAQFLLAWGWTGGRTEHGPWRQVMVRLRQARADLLPAPHELILESRATLEGHLRDLQRLATLNTRWFRFFLPEYWRLRPLPGRLLAACASLTRQPSPLPVDVAELCRRALPWRQLLDDLPQDDPLFEFGFLGDPAELDDAIAALRLQHDRIGAVHELQRALPPGPGEQPGGPAPDLAAPGAPPLSATPLLARAVADRRAGRLLQRIEAALSADEAALGRALYVQLLDAASQGRPEAARQTLAGLAAVWADAPAAAALDHLARAQPPWLRLFLRHWRPAAGTSGVAQDLRWAVERAWRTLDEGGRDLELLEAPLTDPAQLAALAADAAAWHQVAGRGVVAQHRSRLLQAARSPSQGPGLRRLAEEAAKQRYRATLRQLVERYWSRGLAAALPVWLCSPESVASLFPLDPDLFDLVIFDEASQCPVESGIPALVRSRRALVAGDDQQMPPSHFFVAQDDEDGDPEEALLASTSVLSLARIAYPGSVLRWHYRSRHEELVAFSNEAFYGGALLTAPRAESLRIAAVEGLHFQRVPGIWRDQSNAAEAAAAVDRVRTLLLTPGPGGQPPSVGVVTFNRKQAELVEQYLEERAATDETLRAALARDRTRKPVEQLFVRNLENVQGDERDAIVISPGYGPSEAGRPVAARFGPLSAEGGEKRLNVAITRARWGVWVLCSFDPDELDVAGARNPGPRLLRAYLRYARAVAAGDSAALAASLDEAARVGGQRGALGATRRDGPGGLGRRVRRALQAALEAAQLGCSADLGLGGARLDLAVAPEPGGPWTLGLDCSEFLREPDALARDLHRPAFWRRMGWTVHRVSPAAWRDRRAALLAALRRAAAG